jgi:hypothetical protein
MEERESRTVAFEQNLARAAGSMKTQNCVTYKQGPSDPSEIIYGENLTQFLTSQFRNEVYCVSSFPASFAN